MPLYHQKERDVNTLSDYNARDYQRKKQRYRLKLGIQQFITYPVLNIVWLLPLLSVFLLNYLRKVFFSAFSVAKILQPTFSFCLLFLTIILPILITIFILEMSGKLKAISDESKVEMCFEKKQLENGKPILVSKKQDKNIITTEWFSYIPKHIWEERQSYIADVFNSRIIRIEYSEKANRIVITAINSKTSNSKGVIYDETI